jgi:hypothetical protein
MLNANAVRNSKSAAPAAAGRAENLGVRRPLRSFKQLCACPPVTEERPRHRHVHAHCFKVRDLLGDRLPEIRHAAFPGTRHYIQYVALLDGLLIVVAHKQEGVRWLMKISPL